MSEIVVTFYDAFMTFYDEFCHVNERERERETCRKNVGNCRDVSKKCRDFFFPSPSRRPFLTFAEIFNPPKEERLSELCLKQHEVIYYFCALKVTRAGVLYS